MKFVEEMVTVGEVSEALFNAKEEAKYAHLLEGNTYPAASELMFYAKEKEVKKEIDITDLYKNEGMAIFIKGKMVVGIYPDNLENNLKLLANGNMGFDWRVIAKNNGINIE